MIFRLLKHICITKPQWVNTLRQNGCHFAEDIFKWISLFQISLFWLQFHFYWFPGHQLRDNESALFQVMALAPNRRQAIIWTDDEPVYWHIYGSAVVLNGLTRVHPIQHARGFVVLCFVGHILYLCIEDLCDLFTHILQGYFTGTGTVIWLPLCKWSNPEGYG